MLRFLCVACAAAVFGLCGFLAWTATSLLFPSSFFSPDALMYRDGLTPFHERWDYRALVCGVVCGALGGGATLVAWRSSVRK